MIILSIFIWKLSSSSTHFGYTLVVSGDLSAFSKCQQSLKGQKKDDYGRCAWKNYIENIAWHIFENLILLCLNILLKTYSKKSLEKLKLKMVKFA